MKTIPPSLSPSRRVVRTCLAAMALTCPLPAPAAIIAQPAVVQASSQRANDDFGRSVAISGDTMVVGVPLEDGASTGINGDQNACCWTDFGAAYVFVRSGGSWIQQAYLKASNAAYGFGWHVALSGDTVVVGATGEDSSATGVNGNQNDNSTRAAGATYVFIRSGTN